MAVESATEIKDATLAQTQTSIAAPSESVRSISNEKLSLEAFTQLSGNLAGYPFVKVVVDRPSRSIHFINNSQYKFHSDFIAENLLGTTREEIDRNLDDFNRSVYLSPDRRFYLGIISLHVVGNPNPQTSGMPNGPQGDTRFFTIETVEIDNMDSGMLRFFYRTVKEHLDPALPLLFKPANHLQETIISSIDPAEIPRVFSHELFANARYVALNSGRTRGRLRAFANEAEYRRAITTLEWHDIIVMHRVPDDIPRISGIINAHHTTPLSHTNVLASGWQIPNSIQIGVFDKIEKENLNGAWVEYIVDPAFREIHLTRIEKPVDQANRPVWSIQRIKLEEPETINVPILSLSKLKMSDRYRYGTKAANLGELAQILEHGSERLTGFYKVKRPPRPNLLSYLAHSLGLPESAMASEISRAASDYVRAHITIPRGIALPFSLQQEFLESSPRIQQAIGKLKMALELNARETDSLCLSLQGMIRSARMPDKIRNTIDDHIADHLAGVSSFVIRSSSNAEDLEGFSAAGIYESINHVTQVENIFQSIKEVWASLVSPRSVRLRQDVGISLDDCYMGVIVQEEIPSQMGGVLVTTNPMNQSGDFRNVYINVSLKADAAKNVVTGAETPNQYLYNVVEGSGRTLSIGESGVDLSHEQKNKLQTLALCGRLLQSHFSPDYTFSTPMDIEWIVGEDGAICLLQLRPYKK
jgi:hypothetical protein